jgi:hypothetical protein
MVEMIGRSRLSPTQSQLGVFPSTEARFIALVYGTQLVNNRYRKVIEASRFPCRDFEDYESTVGCFRRTSITLRV